MHPFSQAIDLLRLLQTKFPSIAGCRAVAGILAARPPFLPDGYDIQDFARFMREETYRYSPRYARLNVAIHGAESLSPGGGVLAFLHYGSFFLSGAALVHGLGLPYSAVATRHNLKFMPSDEAGFWRGVQRRSSRIYSRPLFYADEPVSHLLAWLRQGGLLGVSIDAREVGRRQRCDLFDFLGHRLYLNLGAARLARLAEVPVYAMTIQYNSKLRRHDLYIGRPRRVTDHVSALQQALDDMAPIVARQPAQLFHDLFGIFSSPPETTGHPGKPS